MSEHEREALTAAIRNAFNDVVRGQGISLHEGRVLDDYGSEQEQAEARKKDTDQHWWEVKDKTLERLHDAITFLDAEGFRYYLPACMTWTLRHPNSEWPVGDWAIGWLTRKDPRLFAVFSDGQSKVIARSLRFVVDHADEWWASDDQAAEALGRYWGKFP